MTAQPTRVHSLLTKSFDLLPGEHVLRSGWVSFEWGFVFFYSWRGRLYLTSQRLIFSPARYPRWPPRDASPTREWPLIVELGTLSSAGRAKAPLRRAFLRYVWYIETADRRAYFDSSLMGRGGKWPEVIAEAAGIPMGQPRAL